LVRKIIDDISEGPPDICTALIESVAEYYDNDYYKQALRDIKMPIRCINSTIPKDIEAFESYNSSFDVILMSGVGHFPEELLSDDYVCHFAGNPDPLPREAQKQFIQAYYEAFPNNTHSIEDIIAKDDKVILRQINRATHDVEFEGLPPSGKQVEYAGIWIFRIGESKIVESWGVEDFLSFWMQLGMELKPKEAEK